MSLILALLLSPILYPIPPVPPPPPVTICQMVGATLVCREV